MYSKINAYIDRLVDDSRPDAPMWNIENQEELQQILFFESNPPQIDEKFLEEIENLKEEN